MSTQDDVRKASSQFHAALNCMLNGDARPRSDFWSHGSAVTAMHRIGSRGMGWEQVPGSWERVAQLSSDGKVELQDRRVRGGGDLACEPGVEHAEFMLAGEKDTGEIHVTNVHQREGGQWKIAHHHTDLAAAVVDVRSRLQPPS